MADGGSESRAAGAGAAGAIVVTDDGDEWWCGRLGQPPLPSRASRAVMGGKDGEAEAR
jgi:hypothetical protein